MKIGAVDVYLNHPRLLVGANVTPCSDLMSEPGELAHDDKHVQLSVRAQVALVHVEILLAPHDEPTGGMTLVFDGPLEFPDGRVMVGDGLGGVQYTLSVLSAGRHPVKLWVDDSQHARSVAVLLVPG